MDVKIYLNLILILASVGSFMDITSIKEKYKNVLVVVLFFLCWCVVPFFSNLEPMSSWSDRVAYRMIFEDTPVLLDWVYDFEQVSKVHGEYGFLFLIAFLKMLLPGLSSHYFLMILLTLTLCLNYSSIMAYTKLRLSAFLGYYTLGFVILDLFYLRSGLATAIVLYSIRFATRRDFWKFFVGWLLACSVHISAFPAIFIYLFCKINWNYLKSLGVLFLAFVLINFRWVDFLANIIDDPRLNYYASRVHVHTVETVVIFTVLFGYLLLINSIRTKNESCNVDNTYYRTLQATLALMILIKALAGEMMVLQRFVMVLASSQYFLLPMLLFLPLKYQKSRVVIQFCAVLLIVGLWLRWYRSNGLELLAFM